MRLQTYINEAKINPNIIPTQEMIDFYEKRTKEHIQRVQKNIKKYMNVVKDGYDKSELSKRIKTHDKSKYSDQEYIPYVWLSWQKKEEREGRSFDVHMDVKNIVDMAWNHHKSKNRHHPEYHNNPKHDMSNEDIIEMVCDWAAMSQEFKNSLSLWIHKHATRREFTDDQIELINKVGDIVK